MTAKTKGLLLSQYCDLPDCFRLITSHKAPCYSLLASLMCIKVHGQEAAKSFLQAESLLHWIPASLHPSHSQPPRDDWRGVGDKVSRIFRILSGLGIGGRRVYTCQQRCKPSSACRKFNMIGAWPNIGWFSHSSRCLGRMSRRLLMTLVCHQLCLGELKNGLVRWSGKKMEEVEKRMEVKRSVELPSPAAMSIFTLWRKKIW